jgi:hypothetical protein
LANKNFDTKPSKIGKTINLKFNFHFKIVAKYWNKIKVFYKRPLSATVNDYQLAVITDCLVATPLPFNTPDTPYFFLQ